MTDDQKLVALIIGWVIPAFIIGFSKKTQGFEKGFWIFIGVWGSWFTFGFYMLVAPFSGGERNEASKQSSQSD